MRKTVAELQEQEITRATPEALGIRFGIPEDEDQEEGAALKAEAESQLTEYLAGFTSQRNCPSCNSLIRPKNMMEGFLLSKFEWGIVNGEGHCRQCKYPVRGDHKVEMEIDGEPAELTFRMPLPYHPSVLEDRQ